MVGESGMNLVISATFGLSDSAVQRGIETYKKGRESVGLGNQPYSAASHGADQ